MLRADRSDYLAPLAVCFGWLAGWVSGRPSLAVAVGGRRSAVGGLQAREVVGALNELFATVVPIVHEHGGWVDKFIGDGLLAVFGAPRREDDHADRALAAAVEIARTVLEAGRGLEVGIGLNSGRVVAGNVGAPGRVEFSVIGDAVNVAARVEAATRETGDAILLSERTRELLRSDAPGLVPRPGIELKGKSAPVGLYGVEL